MHLKMRMTAIRIQTRIVALLVNTRKRRPNFELLIHNHKEITVNVNKCIKTRKSKKIFLSIRCFPKPFLVVVCSSRVHEENKSLLVYVVKQTKTMIKYIRFFAFCISSFRSECWRVRLFPMYFRWPLFVMCPVYLCRFLFFLNSSVDKSPELFIFYVQYSPNRVLLHLKREDWFILISFTYCFFFFVLIIKEKICIHDNSI